MPFSYICLMVAMALPYLWVALSKARPGYNNHAPRVTLERSDGWRQRANWAQLNAFEAFPPFAAAVIIANSQPVSTSTVNLLAGAFIVCRILHGLLYIADQATLRSIIWAGGFGCVIGLFIVSFA